MLLTHKLFWTYATSMVCLNAFLFFAAKIYDGNAFKNVVFVHASSSNCEVRFLFVVLVLVFVNDSLFLGWAIGTLGRVSVVGAAVNYCYCKLFICLLRVQGNIASSEKTLGHAIFKFGMAFWNSNPSFSCIFQRKYVIKISENNGIGTQDAMHLCMIQRVLFLEQKSSFLHDKCI